MELLFKCKECACCGWYINCTTLRERDTPSLYEQGSKCFIVSACELRRMLDTQKRHASYLHHSRLTLKSHKWKMNHYQNIPTQEVRHTLTQAQPVAFNVKHAPMWSEKEHPPTEGKVHPATCLARSMKEYATVRFGPGPTHASCNIPRPSLQVTMKLLDFYLVHMKDGLDRTACIDLTSLLQTTLWCAQSWQGVLKLLLYSFK